MQTVIIITIYAANIYTSLKSDSQCVWTLDSNITILSLFISTFLIKTPRIFFAFPEMTELPSSISRKRAKSGSPLYCNCIAHILSYCTYLFNGLKEHKSFCDLRKNVLILLRTEMHMHCSGRSLILIILVIKRAENFKN